MNDSRLANRKVARRLILLAVAMFGFGFALWPLYNVFCDLTGLGGRSIQIAKDAANVQASDREIRIRFLATTNSALPWVFQPLEKTKSVHLGELSQTSFIAMNSDDKPLIGQATFNVVPPEASLYFVKTECFCFTQQILKAQESREMPVYFYLQSDLPEHIREVTLAYTFYPVDDANALALAQASSDRVD